MEDKDQLASILQKSTESRQETINQKEEELLLNEKNRMKQQIEKVKLDEHARNRSRIAEIWSYLDRIREAIDEDERKWLGEDK